MVAPGRPDAPAPRLLAALADPAPATETLVLSTGSTDSEAQLDGLLAEWAARSRGRILVLGTVGSHRDAKTPRLRALWVLEERARASGRPVLVLRLGPIVGPGTPLWRRLRAGGTAGRVARHLLHPVVEADVLATLTRAIAAPEPWEGWYEVAGPEPLTLEELSDLAGRDPSLPRGAGAWEPALAELAEQRLCDPRPWADRFEIAPRRVSAEARSWA